MKRDIKFEMKFSKEEMKGIKKVVEKLHISKGKLIRNLTLILFEDVELFRFLGFYNVLELNRKNIMLIYFRVRLHLPRTDACDRPQGDAS